MTPPVRRGLASRARGARSRGSVLAHTWVNPGLDKRGASGGEQG
jgi:hypothetical protein